MKGLLAVAEATFEAVDVTNEAMDPDILVKKLQKLQSKKAAKTKLVVIADEDALKTAMDGREGGEWPLFLRTMEKYVPFCAT